MDDTSNRITAKSSRQHPTAAISSSNLRKKVNKNIPTVSQKQKKL